MMVDAYRALAQVVLVERPIADVLSEFAAIAQKWTPGSESSSITLVRGDEAWTAAYSGTLALEADELQYEEGYGPCMDAGRTGMPMVVSDMRTEDRWPTYTARVLERGVVSSLSVPLPFQGLTIGALNNYSGEPNAFGGEALAFATEITSYIGVAVMNADAHAAASTTVKQLQEALESRKVIDMALGILIALHHCSPEEAFAILARTSQHHNRKLRELARVLVEAESTPARPSRSPGSTDEQSLAFETPRPNG
jgi:GAF domain-containing protein